MGSIYDAQEAKVQKVKDRHIKERERRKEQSGKWVPYQPVVTLTGLQSATQLNGQLGKVTDKMINTGQFPVKLENGKMLLIKEENMIREGTRGAEGKNKGIERKEFERAKRRKRQKMKSLRSQARWAKYKKIKPCPRRVHEEIRSAHRNVLERPSATHQHGLSYGNFAKSSTVNGSPRGKPGKDRQMCTS